MKKHQKTLCFLALLAFVIAAGTISSARASIIPTLSLSNLNNGYVQVTVSADSNALVQLYYYNSYSPYNTQLLGNIGYTSVNGYFSSTISNAQYNIPLNASVYVLVDGAISQKIAWPNYNYANNTYTNNSYYPAYANNTPPVYYNNSTAPVYYNNGTVYNNGYNNGTAPVSFSNNNVTVTVGQSTSVILYGGSNSYYVSQGSPVASANISGNTLTVYGNLAGMVTMVICSNGNSCSNFYVTVIIPALAYPASYPAPYSYPYSYQNSYPTYLNQNSATFTSGINSAVNQSSQCPYGYTCTPNNYSSSYPYGTYQ